jgi:hypothetical protein
MLDKQIIAYILQLALNYTGNNPLPADFKVPDVVFVSRPVLLEKMCGNSTTPEQLEICKKYYDEHQIVGLYDRFHPKVYILNTHEKEIRERQPIGLGLLLHEYVHVVQTYYKHHNNPEISNEELMDDEQEAYAIERSYLKHWTQ